MNRLNQLKELLNNLRNNIASDDYLNNNYVTISEVAMDIIEVYGRIEELELKGKEKEEW